MIAVVTGANRGIGLEVVRQLADRGDTVYLGSRDEAKGRAAASPFVAAGLDVRPVVLDVTLPAGAEAVAALVDREHGRLDVLVNNAAIHYDPSDHPAAAPRGLGLRRGCYMWCRRRSTPTWAWCGRRSRPTSWAPGR
ncbi:MAG TPA: SDR family NAD(P)-dependent oxidoreductase [Acidimicrobiales bacterium]|nr:SDR family NAD(P)-dependent oxidoreductase [Acidimicrobiales bacterium]